MDDKLTENVADDRLQAVRQMYREHGVRLRMRFGRRPALLIVDLQQSHTRTWRSASLDPVRATARLLAVARKRGVPAVFTHVGDDSDQPDAGVWGLKAKTLVENFRGSDACRIDIDTKYGDVVGTEEAIESLRTVTAAGREDGRTRVRQ